MILKTERAALRDLLKSFYEVTGIKTAVYNTELEEILAYPPHHSPLCGVMQAERPQACARSNAALFAQCRADGGLALHRCHAGLTEAAAALTDSSSGVVIGYIMYGQITDEPDADAFAARVVAACAAPNAGSEEQARLRALSANIRFYSHSQLQTISQIFNAITSYIMVKHYAYAAEKPMVYSVMEYITAHLQADLSVAALCRRFGVSKAALYALTKPYMPNGIAEFVKSARLARAAELLRKTELPVWQIAECVGFGDKDYFLRVFKKKYGISAGSYRKKP